MGDSISIIFESHQSTRTGGRCQFYDIKRYDLRLYDLSVHSSRVNPTR